MKDIQKLMREVYYFDSSLYYQVDSSSKIKLIKNKTQVLKNFIVLDITKNKIFTKDDFISAHNLIDYTSQDIIDYLDTLRFKVYRKIKLSKDI